MTPEWVQILAFVVISLIQLGLVWLLLRKMLK